MHAPRVAIKMPPPTTATTIISVLLSESDGEGAREEPRTGADEEELGAEGCGKSGAVVDITGSCVWVCPGDTEEGTAAGEVVATATGDGVAAATGDGVDTVTGDGVATATGDGVATATGEGVNPEGVVIVPDASVSSSTPATST